MRKNWSVGVIAVKSENTQRPTSNFELRMAEL
jgi:hypothetical protein